ncbi:MAG: hypothetical protein AAF997_03455 [Myxococcota bacterium]
MSGLFSVLIVVVLGAVLTMACSNGLDPRERRWVWASYLLHVGFACAQVPITLSFYGSSDMFLYFSYGEILSTMMSQDPLHVIPEVTALMLHQQPRLPLTIIGAGTSTGTMSAFAAWSFYLLGPSKYATCIAFAMFSLCGKVAMYRVFRENVEPRHRFAAAVSTLFIPSFVFWSSGLIKEAVAVAGFGWTLYGIHVWISQGRSAVGWALIVLGAVPILLIKPYILFPLALAGGAWYYWSRSLRRGRLRVRPAYLVAAGVFGLGGIVLLGYYFPEYAPDAFTAHAYGLQHVGRGIRGGSNFVLSGEIPTTLLGQLAYAPIALLTSLFRPTIFEVHNLLILANAVEATVLTVLFLRVLVTRNLTRVRKQVLADPFLVFCVVFVVAFGVAAGLTTTNLGTLSRYRSPILPFFAMLLFVAQRPRRARVRVPDPRIVEERVLGPA